ncbi:MAG: undecaprenyldiphospho-muramoylpentapeptide beta-N-acetylglucosaminyltransferase [Deltaproteobacteria bacterium]|nr:undecaprenyldiphospho-muramoylpentapeptide beta-N-acetylglucosaminyltransferase [Deltaproteobacteria bacterium]
MRVVIAGGGTGGHLFPGIALAEELTARGHQVTFVGTERGLESRVVPRAGYALELIDVSGLKRMGLMGTLRGLGRLPRAFLQARAILQRTEPAVVVGVGGYASGPLVMAAALARRPTAILEQNSIPGVTNRILGRVVRRVFGAFEESRGFFPAHKFVLAGNPIRRQLVDALAGQRRPGPSRLFVCGGSLGAQAVNAAVADALALLAARGALPEVLHQTGPSDLEATTARYAAAGLAGRVEVRAFIDDMATAYRDADLVIARAGATTIAELTALGRATVFVPFPFAADDHQTVNARALVTAGAARAIAQSALTPEGLAAEITALFADPAGREKMAEAMRTRGKPFAARAIVDALEELASRVS